MPIDLSEFKNLVQVKPCIVGRWTATLSDEEREKLDAALAEPDISTSNVHRWAQARGAEFRLNAVFTHRRKACSCNRI